MTLRNILGAGALNPWNRGRFLLHLPSFVRLFYRLITDERVPFLVKLVPVLGVLLMLSPPLLELDFIPLVGELDIVVVSYLTLQCFIWLCPPDVVREHVARIGRRD